MRILPLVQRLQEDELELATEGLMNNNEKIRRYLEI